MRNMDHGELYTFASGFKVRWCKPCKVLHGHLYDCEHFPAKIRQEIRADDLKAKTKLGISIAIVIIFVVMLFIVR